MGGDDELDRWKVGFEPLADALLPGDVEVCVHLVDEDDALVRQVRPAAAIAVQCQRTVGSMHLPYDVQDQCRDGAQAVAHASECDERPFAVNAPQPQSTRGHLLDMEFAWQQPVIEEREDQFE